MLEIVFFVKNNLIVFLGLSFFCFECLVYLIDIYRGVFAVIFLLEFIFYKLFFFKLIFGLIICYYYL